MIDVIGIGKGDANEAKLRSLALVNMIIACIGLPGYVVAVMFIDRIGR